VQEWDPARYADNARFVSDLGMPVVDLLAPLPGERILDLGCGDGALSVAITERGAEVIGVDASDAMVNSAIDAGIDAYVVDAERLAFTGEFDAVFSNAALHWMRRPDDVIGGVVRALRPNGRFVGELGGHGCVAAVTTALIAALARRGIDGAARIPWYFPTPEDYSERLERQGFVVQEMLHFPRPTPIPGDILGWLDTFAGPFLAGIDSPEAVKTEAAELLRPSLRDDRGRWTIDYVRLRFSAVLSS
jgi:trans-aconitate methyltransferase